MAPPLFLRVGFEPFSLPLDADAGSERRVVVLQKTAGEAAADLTEGYAGIDIHMLVEGVINKERALVEVAGAVAGDRIPDEACVYFA